MKKILFFVLGCFCYLITFLSAQEEEIFEIKASSLPIRARQIVTIAHRGGMKYAPENTLAAFKNAVDIGGIDYVELDVHLSRDGELVVMHDPTVERTTDGRGKVAEMTTEELKQLDAGIKFSPEFKGEKIPTLREVLEEVSEEIRVVIEIKGKNSEIASKVAEVIDELEIADRVLIHSFSPELIKKFRELEPAVAASIDLTQPSRNIWQDYLSRALGCKATIITFNNIGPRSVVPELVREAHLYGLSVWFGVADKEEDIRWAIEQGVDGIFTDDPLSLVKWLLVK